VNECVGFNIPLDT